MMKRSILCFSLLIVVFSGFSQIPNRGLVGYWPFNGDANDESGNGHDGTVYGAVLADDRFGNPNSAYYFDGENDRIFMGNTLLLSGDSVTISAWFLSDSNGNMINSGNRNTYTIGLAKGDSLRGFHYLKGATIHGSTVGKVKVDPAHWHHVLMSYDGTHHQLYVDGVLRDQNITEGDVWSDQTVYSHFGCYQYLGSNFGSWYEGYLDDIRFYKTVLSEEEIMALSREGQCHEVIFDTVIVTDTITIHDTLSYYDTIRWNAPEPDSILTESHHTFPSAIAVCEDLAVISARAENTVAASKAGAVYIYRREGEKWIQKQRIINPNGVYDGAFGQDLATNGEYLVIAEPNAQRAHIYKEVAGQWEVDTTFHVTDNTSERYGISCAIENHTVVIGSGGIYAVYSANAKGSAYVYELNDGSWENTAILMPSNVQNHDNFACNIEIRKGIIAGTAHGLVGGPSGREGYVCLFEKIGGTWTEIEKLYAPDGYVDNWFAHKFSFNGVTLVVYGLDASGTRSLYIFERIHDWAFTQKLQSPGPDQNAGFGQSLSQKGDLLFAGENGNDELMSNAGMVFMFEKHQNQYHYRYKIPPPAPAVDGKFSHTCMASSGNYLFVNHGYHDGATVVFKLANDYHVIYDTMVISIMDTNWVTLNDTLHVIDTTRIFVHDTIPVFDTSFVTVQDTNLIVIMDTIRNTVVDTVPVCKQLTHTYDTLIIELNLATGDQPADMNEILVYPNPTSDKLHIHTGDHSRMTEYIILISSSNGRLVYHNQISEQEIIISLREFGIPGLYYLNILDSTYKNVARKKIVLQ